MTLPNFILEFVVVSIHPQNWFNSINNRAAYQLNPHKSLKLAILNESKQVKRRKKR